MPRRRTCKTEGGRGPLRAVSTLIDRAKPKVKEEDCWILRAVLDFLFKKPKNYDNVGHQQIFFFSRFSGKVE